MNCQIMAMIPVFAWVWPIALGFFGLNLSTDRRYQALEPRANCLRPRETKTHITERQIYRKCFFALQELIGERLSTECIGKAGRQIRHNFPDPGDESAVIPRFLSQSPVKA
jgi:hypothetical protein